MGEKEDKEKAEKLAAAKKRVAQLQAKKKKAAGSGGVDKTAGTSTTKGKTKKKTDKETADDGLADEGEGEGENEAEETVDIDTKGELEDHPPDDAPAKPVTETLETTSREPLGDEDDEDEDEDTAALNNVIRAANGSASSPSTQDTQMRGINDADVTTSAGLKSRQHQPRQLSISLQSKLRSTSFRQGPLSPTGSPEDTDSLYRKQTFRIEELERENQRLAKEASDGETRWRRSEEELEELREKAADQTNTSTGNEEIEKLRAEIETLRKNQRQGLSAGTGKSRSGSVNHDDNDLRKDIESKDSTISDLQLEVSRLRSQLSSQAQGCETHGEQIAALQSTLERTESSMRKVEIELSDTKKALSRASEKAVIDGTERTSKETRIRTLTKEVEDLLSERDGLNTRVESLEKKIEAMNKLHRETEDRTNKKLASAEAQSRGSQSLRAQLESHEREIARLREAKKQSMSGGGGGDDDDRLDELEDEGRERLERRIRELEGENFELRRGVWRDKRKELQPGMTADDEAGGDVFDDVDLSGSMPVPRRRSSISRLSATGPTPTGQTRHSGFTQVINSGLAAFRGSTTTPDQHQSGRPRNDSLLQEFDDDDDAFDMNAFATAQREEEMRKMVEHVKEVKRGLKNWIGWRLDLVDSRKGSDGGGVGVSEVFEI